MNVEDVKIEFGIHRVVRLGAEMTVTGRVFRGPIRVGDCFELAYRIRFSGETKSERCNITPVNLVVLKMVAYKHEFAILEEGMTAELFLRGDLFEELDEDSVLGGQANLENLT